MTAPNTSKAPVWVPFVCSKCGYKHHMTEATHAELGDKPHAHCGGSWQRPAVKAKPAK